MIFKIKFLLRTLAEGQIMLSTKVVNFIRPWQAIGKTTKERMEKFAFERYLSYIKNTPYNHPSNTHNELHQLLRARS